MLDNQWYGYGNGFKAVAYQINGSDECVVRVYRNNVQEDKHYSPNINSAKRWAERNYLKAKNY